MAFLPKSLETSEKGKGKLSKGLAYLAVHKSKFHGALHPTHRLIGTQVSGRHVAVVRQPRRGGRAAHREAAEPVL